MIVEETYRLLKSRYAENLEKLYIDDVKIGIFLTAVRLSDDSTGVASTIQSSYHICTKEKRDYGDFSPLKIKGKKVLDVLETDKITSSISTLKCAVLNAISSTIILSGDYNILNNTDPIQIIDLGKSKTITVVGAFQSYIRKISASGNKLHILEFSDEPILPENKSMFVPAGKYAEVIPSSDIVIISGQTLVNNTIDNLLSVVSEGTQVVVTGPSGSLIPDILFEHKVSIVGSLKINKPEILFDVVSEGGTGYHLFEYCAEKICILQNNELQAE